MVGDSPSVTMGLARYESLNRDRVVELFQQEVRAAYVAAKKTTLAANARQNFNVTIPAWDGGVDRWGRQHVNCWPALAAFLAANDCNPLEFFRAQIRSNRLPLPHTLRTSAALDRYAVFVPENRKRLCVELDLQLNRLKLGLKSAALAFVAQQAHLALAQVVLDPASGISPLLGYCLARQIESPELAARLQCAAATQLLQDLAGYVDVWKQLIPDDFRVNVKSIYGRTW